MRVRDSEAECPVDQRGNQQHEKTQRLAPCVEKQARHQQKRVARPNSAKGRMQKQHARKKREQEKRRTEQHGSDGRFERCHRGFSASSTPGRRWQVCMALDEGLEADQVHRRTNHRELRQLAGMASSAAGFPLRIAPCMSQTTTSPFLSLQRMPFLRQRVSRRSSPREP